MPVNKTLLHKIADAVEKERVGDRKIKHDQMAWGFVSDGNEPCGTHACVAGFACLIEDGRIDYNVKYRGSELLGLDYEESEHLFYYVGYVNSNRDLVPDALRWMAESGEIDWIKGFEYARCVRDEMES